jgi:CRP-like cAMP-binding protein
MSEQFIHWIEGILPVSPELKNALEAVITIISVPKKHKLLRPRQQHDYMYFVLDGLVCGYTKPQGKEQIRWFRKENEPVACLPRSHGNNVSCEYIATMEPCRLAAIPAAVYHELTLRFPELLTIDTLLLQRQLAEVTAYTNMLKLPVKERYRYFEKHYHDLLGRIAQKHIASFLHTTPETISRIRAGKYPA